MGCGVGAGSLPTEGDGMTEDEFRRSVLRYLLAIYLCVALIAGLIIGELIAG